MDQDQKKKKYQLSFQFNHPSPPASALQKKGTQIREENTEFFVQEETPLIERSQNELKLEDPIPSLDVGHIEETHSFRTDQRPSFSGETSWWNDELHPTPSRKRESTYEPSNEQYEYQGYTYEAVLSNRKRRSGHLLPRFRKSTKLLLVAGSAILVGLIFGLAVLSIFSNLAEEPHTEAAAYSQPSLQERLAAHGQAAPPGTSPALTPSSPTNETNSPVAESEQTVIHWPSRTYFFVQAGAFSEYQAAQVMLQQYTQAGYPGRISGNENPYRLFVGVSPLKQDAQALARYYEAQGLESYVKEILIPDASISLGLSGTKGEEELNNLLEKGDELLVLLSQTAAQGLGEEGQEIALEVWKQIQELHRDYIQLGKTIWEQWLGEEKQLGLEMDKQLAAAVDALETYRQRSHDSYLWASQQATLNYIETYHALIKQKNG